jgi:hypothetical protein
MKATTILSSILLLAISTLAAPPVKNPPPYTGPTTNTAFVFTGDPDTRTYLEGINLAIDVGGVRAATIGSPYSGGSSFGMNSVVGLGAFDSFAFGSRVNIADHTITAFGVGCDHFLASDYSFAAGDANYIYRSATGAAAFGNNNALGDPNDPYTDLGSYSAAFGIGNRVSGRSSAVIGVGIYSQVDSSLTVGQGVSFNVPLAGPTEPGAINGGYKGRTYQIGPSGMILSSPNGSRWLIKISDTGVLLPPQQVP